MQLTMNLKDDIIALIEHVQAAQEKAGEPWSDTAISKAATNSGDFIKSVRVWSGGKPSPTMASIAKLEDYLRAHLGEDGYQRFLKTRTSPKK